MARRNVINLLSLLIAVFLVGSPRLHVETRSLENHVNLDQTTNNIDELTTQASILSSKNLTTTTEPIRAATTAFADYSSSESSSFELPEKQNRSLYEELKATSNNSSFFETSSEFIKFENLKLDSNSEESLEGRLDDELGIKNNSTKEERHTLDEATFDEQSIKYSSIKTGVVNKTSDDDERLETTAQPAGLTTAKKGKYLDLVPRDEDNINATIPNAAEVWALAGMREVETRRPLDESNESSSDVELLGSSLNNTAKNLLDWIEIAKMNNETLARSASAEENQTEEIDLTQATVINDISGDDDPAASENKDVGVFVSSLEPTASTSKSAIKDNRLHVENGIGEFGGGNKSMTASSRIDSEVFTKSQEEREESAIELLDSFKHNDHRNTKESLRAIDAETDFATTTEPNQGFTTEPAETTTAENYETSTSIIDTFTVIGEDEDGDDVFKRTITEVPQLTTTERPDEPTITTHASLTTVSMELVQETTTDIPNTSSNEIPEYNKSTTVTKSFSVRVVTTNSPLDEVDSTIYGESSSSTLVSRFRSSYQPMATTQQSDFSTSNPTEIIDDDKFKYSTWLPETTADSEIASKRHNFGETSTTVTVDSLNKENLDGEQSGGNIGIISASVSVVVLLIIAAVGYFLLKRRNQQKFSQRCRPVGLDAYSLDNVSVYNSVRRKANALRFSKRSYGNSAFEDPSLQSNVLDYNSLQDFTKNKLSIQNEFKDIPQVTVRVDEMPENCEDKNRYANVIPIPETRVKLQKLSNDERSEYINANFVRGPKDGTNYYIATQAPLENTVADFWRMIWEQNSKVIIMATDLTENGVERSAEYIPASVVLDNSQAFGDFQVTLKSREVKGKYAVSQVHLKNLKSNTWREIMHLWYSWPENGCPTDESSVISLLLEARSYLRTALPEQLDENSNATEITKDNNDKEKFSTLDKTKSLQRSQGPLTVHCSPGTGRTGTIIACDIILRMLETPPRQIDIPQIVYLVRKGRASSIRTKDQYEFIYNIANAYAIKLNTAQAES